MSDGLESLFSGNDKLLKSKDVMAFLNISRTKLWELTKNKEIPAFRIGGDFRYKASEVKKFLEKSRY